MALGGYEGSPLASAAISAGASSPSWRGRGRLLARPAPVVLRLHAPAVRRLLARAAPRPVGAGPALRPAPAARERDRAALHGHRLPGCRRHARPRPRPTCTSWRRTGAARRPRSAGGVVALVPIAVTFGPRLPFTMRAVMLPRWYTEVAPTLPPGRVLLSYPAPFSGIQSAMSWQAVNRMHYSQAGGGGPQGVATGPARRRPASRPERARPSASAARCPPARRPSTPRCATRWPSGRSPPW